MLNLGVLVSGNGTNLQSIIDSIESGSLAAGIRVVISNRPDAYALERAKRHAIPFRIITNGEFPSREAFDAEAVRVLREARVELVLLAGFMRILSPLFIRAFPLRIMNIHPSLLPAFRGLDVQRKAVEYGAKFSGCTVHFVDEGLDTGPIIIQAALPLLDTDTAESLSRRILEEEHRIYPQAVQLFAEGRIRVEGRRVFVRDSAASGDSIENPAAEIFNKGPG